MAKTRRQFLLQAGAGVLAVTMTSLAQANQTVQLKSASVLTDVDGRGLRLIGIVLEFEHEIAGASLKASSFEVSTRTITDVYASASKKPIDAAPTGRFVLVMLDPLDDGARLYETNGRQIVRREPVAELTILEPLTSAAAFIPPSTPIITTGSVNLVVDDFEPKVFTDEANGIVLRYNLFVPKDYDPAKQYPLVNFMHDASATSEIVDTTLVQGLGAVIWARAEEQSERPCFVLAPQFDVQIVNDQSEATGHLDTIVRLIEKLSQDYSIDRKRLYTTGQSGGGMLSMAINIKYPDFFAASLLVACQWDAKLVDPMATDRLFIVVSAEDAKALPGQNAITDRLESLGATVSRAVWNGRWSPAEFDLAYRSMVADGASVNYVVLKEGTVIPDGVSKEGAAGHMNTWPIAYDIRGLREWLFAQSA